MAWADRDWERGSGTVVGVALVLMVGALLAALAAGANMLIAGTVARTAADQAALAGASAFSEGSADPCSAASMVAFANRGILVSCEVIDEDVRVRVGVRPSVAMLPQVERVARAGPVACAAR